MINNKRFMMVIKEKREIVVIYNLKEINQSLFEVKTETNCTT